MSTLHQKILRDRCEELGYTFKMNGAPSAVIEDAEGKVLWHIRFRASGQFLSASNNRTSWAGDYRSHSYATPPRQLLDNFMSSEIGLV